MGGEISAVLGRAGGRPPVLHPLIAMIVLMFVPSCESTPATAPSVEAGGNAGGSSGGGGQGGTTSFCPNFVDGTKLASVNDIPAGLRILTKEELDGVYLSFISRAADASSELALYRITAGYVHFRGSIGDRLIFLRSHQAEVLSLSKLGGNETTLGGADFSVYPWYSQVELVGDRITYEVMNCLVADDFEGGSGGETSGCQIRTASPDGSDDRLLAEDVAVMRPLAGTTLEWFCPYWVFGTEVLFCGGWTIESKSLKPSIRAVNLSGTSKSVIVEDSGSWVPWGMIDGWVLQTLWDPTLDQGFRANHRLTGISAEIPGWHYWGVLGNKWLLSGDHQLFKVAPAGGDRTVVGESATADPVVEAFVGAGVLFLTPKEQGSVLTYGASEGSATTILADDSAYQRVAGVLGNRVVYGVEDVLHSVRLDGSDRRWLAEADLALQSRPAKTHVVGDRVVFERSFPVPDGPDAGTQSDVFSISADGNDCAVLANSALNESVLATFDEFVLIEAESQWWVAFADGRGRFPWPGAPYSREFAGTFYLDRDAPHPGPGFERGSAADSARARRPGPP